MFSWGGCPRGGSGSDLSPLPSLPPQAPPGPPGVKVSEPLVGPGAAAGGAQEGAPLSRLPAGCLPPPPHTGRVPLGPASAVGRIPLEGFALICKPVTVRASLLGGRASGLF